MAAEWGAGDTEVIDLVAVVECGEESHVAASSSSLASSSSSTFRASPPPRGNRGLAAAGSREVRRSKADSGEGERRSARTGAGAGRPGKESGRGRGGRQLEAAEALASPEAEDKGRLVRPPGPEGSRRGPRGRAPPSGPRRRSILFLLGCRGPGAQLPLVLPLGLPRLPAARGGGWVEPGGPRLPGPRPMCIYELD